MNPVETNCHNDFHMIERQIQKYFPEDLPCQS